MRKPGKLPGKVESQEYQKEYGKDKFEIQIDLIEPGSKVVIIDDILATGGSVIGAIDLVKKIGVCPIGLLFVYEIAFLKGREKLPKDMQIYSIGIEE